MKSVVFTYGRFSPPHKGHRLMIEQIIETARRTNKTPVVVVSHSYGNAKNPLPVENKVRILRRWFPGVTILTSAKDRSIAKIAQNFNKNSIMIVGQNRENSFKFLNFKKVAVSRTANAPSATMARAAALAGNTKAFKNMTGYNLTTNLRNKVIKASVKK
jgi:nicotinamide mononucleotide adenylyltransferase